jgi:SsrA-binding protein
MTIGCVRFGAGEVMGMATKLLCQNKKARFLYHIDETWEAGIVLLGSEVKALREGKGSLVDSYARIEGGEVFLHHMHIGQYRAANQFNHESRRVRKLLLHKREIRKLTGKVEERGYTLVPLRVYLDRGLVKVEIALVRGKKLHDKREDMKKKTAEREMERALKGETK